MKKILLSLFLWFVVFISFCSATVFNTYSWHCNNNGNFCIRTTDLNLNWCVWKYYFMISTTGDVKYDIRFPTYWVMNQNITNSFYWIANPCDSIDFSFVDRSTNWFDYVIKVVSPDEILNIWNWWTCPECPTCPEINTWEILSWYILESEIDNQYCEDHWYCPLINSWDIIWSWDNWSALFINEIQHPSAPLINITIPEEFDWTYTWDEEEYDVVVNWYNVDTEYIDWIIRNQTTLPDKTDFNKAISELVPLLVPWLVIILFLYFVFRSIKKIF